MNKIGISELADITRSISDYHETCVYFKQLSGDDETTKRLTEFWDTNIKSYDARRWNDTDLHVVSQSWGNTSCGWETIGGAAISYAYTVIIENRWHKLAFVYYGGQKAYICEMDERYQSFKHDGFKCMPGVRSCKDALNVLWTADLSIK